jgi:hypothetical protein
VTRLTISLPDDLYAMARAHAVANRKSISKAIVDLLRRGRGSAPQPAKIASFHMDPVTQLPVVSGRSEQITGDEIQQAMDRENLRDVSEMGSRPGNPGKASAR